MRKRNHKAKVGQDGRCYIGARVPHKVKAKLDRRAINERRSLANVVELLLLQATAADPEM